MSIALDGWGGNAIATEGWGGGLSVIVERYRVCIGLDVDDQATVALALEDLSATDGLDIETAVTIAAMDIQTSVDLAADIQTTVAVALEREEDDCS